MPTAHIKIAPDFMITAGERYKIQHPLRYPFVVLGMLALVIGLALAAWRFWIGQVLQGVFLGATSAFMLFVHHFAYWRLPRTCQERPDSYDVTIEFTEAGFHMCSPKPDAKRQWSWSSFGKVVHFRDGFLLLEKRRTNIQNIHWIPLSSLQSDSEADELEALLRSKIPEHKTVA